MNVRHALGLLGVACALAAAVACNQPQRRNDWRSPSSPSPPAMTAPHEQPPFLPTDGGAPSAPPIVQPSSSDIQI
jgi:hypothetical protein